ncbi:MAG: DUF4401 domain-containing protein [Chloroflexi bacterium]|nr:DUF4401 domain-containing protein [Chloroflexota bacterium]
MNTQFTLREVLSQLADEGLAKPLELVTALSAPAEVHGSSLPWFVKLFIGIAAWIAAILIVSFFFAIGIIEEESALGFGLVFCAAAIPVNRAGYRNTFWIQLSLAASLTGQALAIIGLFSIFDELLIMTLLVAMLETALILLHRDSVLRFISALIVVGFFLALIFEQEMQVSIHALILALAAGTLAIHLNQNRIKLLSLDETILPVGSAITFSLLGILILPLADEFDLRWEFTAIVLFGMLIYLLWRIGTDLGYSLRNRVVIALLVGALLLLIPALRMPGLLAALIVLALGFWRNNQGLVWLAAIFLVFYIWAFYYSLEWTLLVKSLVLLASGLVLLGLRFFVVQFTANSGEPS